MLFEPAQFEALTDHPWDPAHVEHAIAAIVADADAAFDPETLWPAHEWDGWRAPLPMKNLYVGAAGVIWALDTLRRRGHAETSLDVAGAAARTLELERAEPDFMAGETHSHRRGAAPRRNGAAARRVPPCRRRRARGRPSRARPRQRHEPDRRRASSIAQTLARSKVSKQKETNMPKHKTATREDWLAARLELLAAEKELTRQSDELARRRQELPWVPIDKDYRFETEDGDASLADLFRGRSQLLVYHFMFAPDYTAGCPACSAIADGFDGFAVHLANHDVMLWAVSRAPLAKLLEYRQRMGWSFPWASSFESDFNYDFQVAHTEEQERSGALEYNFRETASRPSGDVPREGPFAEWAARSGTDWATYARERPGMSAFALEDGGVYHTYSAYARGLDVLWGMYQWLDRAPLGRNESRAPTDPLNWFRRHDEYETERRVSGS
jgi:predicted dithiol-disulfide oxidoreductase (DUF899 family)